MTEESLFDYGEEQEIYLLQNSGPTLKLTQPRVQGVL